MTDQLKFLKKGCSPPPPPKKKNRLIAVVFNLVEKCHRDSSNGFTKWFQETLSELRDWKYKKYRKFASSMI